MEYNPLVQFRCAIIRGKAASALDNLLPAYANIIEELSPCEKSAFAVAFNLKLSRILGNDDKKTLDNHRTEIAGKLFGMYFEDEDGLILSSERTRKYLQDSDQPAFFKDIIFKFQFPNGMDKPDTAAEKIRNGINIRQFPYILKLLLLAQKRAIPLTKDDIGYYVLNSLHVLQGKINPEAVLDKIAEHRAAGIVRKVEPPAGKASSYAMQHINEQLNLLEIANLITMDGRTIRLNMKELELIKFIAGHWNVSPGFDAYSYDLNVSAEKAQFYRDWQAYYSTVSEHAGKFHTTVESLNIDKAAFSVADASTVELGDEGEQFVYEYEKERVSKFDPRLVKKVIALGKTKGLGYDIQSVVAERGETSDFVKYIEVKATKRVTVPNIGDSSWMDTLNLTRNEWVAAAQHKGSYSIYRVYFTPGKVMVYVINDPYSKNENGKLRSVPLNYRLDFSNQAVDSAFHSDKQTD